MKGTLVILILLFVSTLVQSQTSRYKCMKHLTVSDDLSHNGVTDIMQDSRGYLWFATFDGLNRYDGYEIKTFKTDGEHPLFKSNRIRSILEDSKKNIVIGTDECITVYNPKSDSFKTIYVNASHKNRRIYVRRIIENVEKGKLICITENEGILIFTNDYVFEKKLYPSEEKFANNVEFSDGIALDSRYYLLTSKEGAFQFNLETLRLKHLPQIKSGSTYSLVRINESHVIFAGNNGAQIVSLEKINGAYKFSSLNRILEDHSFRCVQVDRQGKLWLGTTRQGVMLINNIDRFLKHDKFTPVRLGYLPLARTSCIRDIEGVGILVGTFTNGVLLYNEKELPFYSNDLRISKNRSKAANTVTSISALDHNKFYIFRSSGEAGIYNTKKHKIESLRKDKTTTVLPRNDTDLFIDSWGNRIIRLKGALYYSTKTPTGYKNNNLHLEGKVYSTSNIRSVQEDKFGNVWIAFPNDVVRLQFDENRMVSSVEILNSDHDAFRAEKIHHIRRIYMDPLYPFMWIATDETGLYRIKLMRNKALKELPVVNFQKESTNPSALPSNFVSSILRTDDSRLWVGTEGRGFCLVENSNTKPTFHSIDRKDGLSNNVVKSILEDKDNNLWISTNVGLNKYDPKTKKIRIFRKENGLPFEDFRYGSVKLENGYLIFLGNNDFCAFDPSTIDSDELIPKVELANLRIQNRDINVGDTINGRVLLSKALFETEELNLEYNENSFVLDAVSLHYSSPKNHELMYQLYPVDEEWTITESNNKDIRFNRHEPGEYVLRVRVSNSLGQWSKIKELRINIKPPYWRTTTAYIIYILFILLLFAGGAYYFVRLNALTHRLEIEQMEKDKVKEVNAAKLRFFSNISHEIKTPLTLISGPVDSIIEHYKNNNDLSEKLQIIQRQSKKISQLVDQVHDFQRADANQLTLKQTTFCFNHYIDELIADFQFLANVDGKNLTLTEKDNNIWVKADSDKLEKIINNLLNNALKFTSKEDNINIQFEANEKELRFSVQDTGRGIDASDIPFIFDRFFQSRKEQSQYIGGSGIGLAFSKALVELHFGTIEVESTLNVGTTFTIVLPIITEAMSEKEVKRENSILKEEKKARSVQSVTKSNTLINIKSSGTYKDATIFYVEDNAELRRYVTDIISKFFDVKPFSNGKECLAAMDSEWPDLVISDVLMPELNGFNLCRHIKSNTKTSHIPVILLTACISIEEQVEGLEVGADAYIKKPFDFQYLVSRIETLLYNRQQLRDRYNLDFPLTIGKKKTNDNDILFLEKLYKLMEENLDNTELDMNGFAKKLYLNRTDFFKKVKALTNQTPFELLKMYRLKRAAEILVKQEHAVNEVYVMTGFKSRSNFSKLFKERYNCSPGRYSKEAIKESAESIANGLE